MNNNGLFCSTLILCTLAFQGCTQLNSQVAKVKSVLPGKQDKLAMLAEARALESQKEWVGARKKYELFLKRNPQSVKACHRLGIVCSHLGDTVAATRYFTQAKQLDPTNSEILNDFGYALYKRGQFDAAEKILSAALQNDANNPRIMNNLALTVGHQGRFKESYTMFRNIMPEGEAHANVAYIHTQRGEGALALKEYDLALTADPTLKSAGQAAAELALLKSRIQERQEQNAEQQLAAAPDKTRAETATRQIKPESTRKQLEQAPEKTAQLASLNSSSSSGTKPKQQLTQKQPVAKESLISQVSLKKENKTEQQKKELLARDLLKEDKPVQQAQAIKRSIPQPAPKQTEEQAPLEINPFRSLNEIESLDEIEEEKPVIIRISNEVPAEDNTFRTPQELARP